MSRDPRRTEAGRSRGALIALALVVAAVPYAWALEFEPQVAIVTQVVDGDSLVLRFPDAPGDARIEYRANLIGVDAPGKGEAECAAGMVTAIARRLLQDERIRVEWDSHDRQTPDGRLLVYVHHFDDRDADLNATYIEQGWGWVPRAYPADRKQKYLELEREARAAKRGLWGMPCAPEPQQQIYGVGTRSRQGQIEVAPVSRTPG